MKNSVEYLMAKGIKIFTGEYALNKDDALHYSQILHDEKRIILGGDVLIYDEKRKKLMHNYDSWYMDDCELTCDISYQKTVNYIENYHNMNNRAYYILIIRADA